MKFLITLMITILLLTSQTFASAYYPGIIFETEQCVIVELEKQRVHFYNYWGSFHKEFICSTGAGGATPVMDTKIYTKIPCPVSAQYNAQMPYWLEITPGGNYGIHALDLWENPYYLDDLGTPVSHGCIRLSPKNAKWLYEHVETGIPVFVVYRK